jgi:TP901 family phage tail tape measure protein
MPDRVVSYVFRGDIKGLQASMTAAGHSVGKLANDLTKADAQSAKFRQGLTSVGDTAGKIGLVAAAGLGAIVLTTAKFDKQMSEVQAATGETAANMDKLRQAAIDAGAATAFSASEAAEGITELSKAGVSTADVLSGGLTGALDLAAAGQIGVGEAAEFSARAMTQFNLEGSQVPHIADLLAAAAGKAVGEVGDFGQALNQAGLVASQTGLSIEDTVGTLAAFAQAGLQGSDAGTSFKSMLQRLQNPLGQGAKAMESLGINAYDANGNFIGITEVAGQLQEKLGGLTQAQRDAAMAQIFGSDAVRAASILYKEGAEGIQSWIDQTNDAGFAAEQAAAKMDNLAGDWEEFTGSLETALIGAGSGSQGMLRDLVQGATDAVNAFNELSPAAQGTATALLGVTAVTGGGLWFASKTIQGIANTREALSNLGITADATKGKLTGLAKAGVILGAAAIGDELMEIADATAVMDLSGLTRDLAIFGETGRATGEIAKNFGADLQGLDALIMGSSAGLGESLAYAAQSQDSWVDSIENFLGGGNQYVDRVSEMDTALATLAQSNMPAAEASFAQLTKVAEQQGVSVKELQALFPEYAAELERAASESDGAASAVDGLTAATQTGSSAIQAHTESIESNIEAMRDQRSEAIRAANAAINYQASLDDARKSLKENGKTLDITTEKGRANKTALLGVASAWNEQSAAAKNAPGAHKAAIASFVDLATKMGMGEDKARALAKRILELPDKKVNVTADTSQAEGALSLIRRNLLDLDGRTARTYVTTVYSQAGYQTRGGLQERATGGEIDGHSPHKRADNILIAATAGEFMHQVDAVDYYGLQAMHAINQRRIPKEVLAGYAYGGAIGDIPGYASGGDVEPLNRKDFREFNLSGQLGVKGIRDELREFRRAVREAGDDWTKALGRMSDRAVGVAHRFDRVSDRLDDARDDLRDLRAARRDYAREVRGTFDHDIFGNGVAGLRTQLAADRNDARSMLTAVRRADRKGLSGGLEKALIASGDLNTAQQVAGMSSGQIRRLERLYAQRAQQQTALGNFGGAEMYNSQIRQERREVAQLRRTNQRLAKALERIEDRIEAGAARGTRAGIQNKTGKANQRRRANR